MSLRCFNVNTEGAEGAKHLLKALAQCAALEERPLHHCTCCSKIQLPLQMQDLDLSYCDQIPGDAWEALQTANWSNLKKAFFDMRLGQGKGVDVCLSTPKERTQQSTFLHLLQEPLGSTHAETKLDPVVHRLSLYLVQCISVLLRCFYERTKGAEGAKHLLKALAQSAALEEHPLHSTAHVVPKCSCLYRRRTWVCLIATRSPVLLGKCFRLQTGPN